MAIDSATLDRMTDILRHRGPDGRGVFHAPLRTFDRAAAETAHGACMPGVALGHRRLSVIDLEGGRQPMTSADGQVTVVFNGEIYNYVELRKRLEQQGCHFRTNSDTEVLLAMYQAEGVDCLRHFNGMFAFALWDARQQRMFIARDRLGKKPLVYRHEPGRLIFASELKSLLEVPGIERRVDRRAVDLYFSYLFIPGAQSILQGFAKLPPAHYAIWQDDKFEVRPYWCLPCEEELPDTAASEANAMEELRGLLESSVDYRLRSDVPLGVFLSGGVDSSLMAALAKLRSQQPVRTFSIGFDDPEFDESHYARQVAEHLKTEHTEFRVEAKCAEILPQLVWHYDEPFSDSSAVPTWIVSKLAREHVTVVLSGDGGDELFAGYGRYQAASLAAKIDRLPWPMRKLLAARIWQSIPTSTKRWSKTRQFQRFSKSLRLEPAQRYLNFLGSFDDQRREALYQREFAATLLGDPVGEMRLALARVGKRDFVTAVSLADLTMYLPDDLMVKVDIASMAHGLECRAPLLDYRVAELAAKMPISWKLQGKRTKRILQKTFGHLLPAEVFTRTKMGFAVPLRGWFRGELRELIHDVLLDGTARQRAYIRADAVEQMLREHDSGQRDHGYRLWPLMMFELWLREWKADL